MAFRKLKAYQKGFELAMLIFEVSITDQIRRSSRSVCVNLAEAYRKRIYPKHFISKLTDSDAENAETLGWLEFAEACNYISSDKKMELEQLNNEVGKLINYMINNPNKFN